MLRGDCSGERKRKRERERRTKTCSHALKTQSSVCLNQCVSLSFQRDHFGNAPRDMLDDLQAFQFHMRIVFLKPIRDEGNSKSHRRGGVPTW